MIHGNGCLTHDQNLPDVYSNQPFFINFLIKSHWNGLSFLVKSLDPLLSNACMVICRFKFVLGLTFFLNQFNLMFLCVKFTAII